LAAYIYNKELTISFCVELGNTCTESCRVLKVAYGNEVLLRTQAFE
jgi:hypothetical protein